MNIYWSFKMDELVKLDSGIDLRQKVKALPAQSEFDPVENAQRHLDAMSDEFHGWMKTEVHRLSDHWAHYKDASMNEECAQTFFAVSHDIKGQAATFGFAEAGAIAGLICDALENSQINQKAPPMPLLEQGVYAIIALSKAGAAGNHPATSSLVYEYSRAVDKFCGAS